MPKEFVAASPQPARKPGDAEDHFTEMAELPDAEISPLFREIKDLDARIDAINTGMNALVTVDTLIKQIEPPFTERKDEESLKDYVKRFNQAVLEVEDPSDKVVVMAMMDGLRPSPLFISHSKNVSKTLSTL
ncbi:hypothetical protein Acr_17g0006260 [Actinidia rufa]|uniref:Uncharacterized protein n=1 Tax=Actinidia rufa TaxID=165716 RepID=A0A7J0G2P4_9ERIC|nr:hypothetical protein Acr_17g0006260 [Actinidia rufa]